MDVGNRDDGPVGMTSKADILTYVKESLAYICRAVADMDEDNALEIIPHPYDPESTKLTRLALAAGYACHGWEHYWQMVVYQRMNGIVPPPSRVRPD